MKKQVVDDGQTIVKKLSKKEVKALGEALKVTNRLTLEDQERLKKMGWKFEDYAMEINYKGFPLVIEFCIGDFCTYPCSKRGHWLLETKYRAPDLLHALLWIEKLKERIDKGEKWRGEDD